MESNHKAYDFDKSIVRIDDILNSNDVLYEEVDEIPSRDKLTFTNGFYVNKVTALFVDVRGSSSLPSKYRRPTLAKIYRSYISELVAIMNSNVNCAEISIVGDCVWGLFNSHYKYQIEDVLVTSAKISSLINVLNCKLSKKGINPIEIGIGIDFGRVLMIKAGYSGSGLNDVVWMGDVVNGASKLCSYGNKTIFDKKTMIDSDFYSNLNDEHKNLFVWNNTRECYHGDIIDVSMNDWATKNCK